MNGARVEERKVYGGGKAATVYPFEESIFTKIDAYARHEPPVFGGAQYGVNWPAIGTVSVDRARQFALAILTACDWVDAQQRLRLESEVEKARRRVKALEEAIQPWVEASKQADMRIQQRADEAIAELKTLREHTNQMYVASFSRRHGGEILWVEDIIAPEIGNPGRNAYPQLTPDRNRAFQMTLNDANEVMRLLMDDGTVYVQRVEDFLMDTARQGQAQAQASEGRQAKETK